MDPRKRFYGTNYIRRSPDRGIMGYKKTKLPCDALICGLYKKIILETITRFIWWICTGISWTGSEWDVGVRGRGGVYKVTIQRRQPPM